MPISGQVVDCVIFDVTVLPNQPFAYPFFPEIFQTKVFLYFFQKEAIYASL